MQRIQEWFSTDIFLSTLFNFHARQKIWIEKIAHFYFYHPLPYFKIRFEFDWTRNVSASLHKTLIFSSISLTSWGEEKSIKIGVFYQLTLLALPLLNLEASSFSLYSSFPLHFLHQLVITHLIYLVHFFTFFVYIIWFNFQHIDLESWFFQILLFLMVEIGGKTNSFCCICS